jgi:hypothetical protein
MVIRLFKWLLSDTIILGSGDDLDLLLAIVK